MCTAVELDLFAKMVRTMALISFDISVLLSFQEIQQTEVFAEGVDVSAIEDFVVKGALP